MSEKIGRHKGAIETLLHEKKELSRLLQIVNSQLERHLQELEDAGVDTDAFIDSLLEEDGKQKEKRSQSREGNRNQSNNNRSNRGNRNEQNSRSNDSNDRSSGSGRDFSPSR